MRCSKCGKELSEDTKFCSYCGEKVVEPEHISEDIIHNDFKSNAKNKESLADKIKDKFLAFWSKLNIFEKICTIMLVVFGLLCAIAVISGKIACIVLAIVSALSVVIALLINKEIIKFQKKWVSVVALIVAAVMTIPYISVFKLDYGNAENFEWSEIALNEVIPETHNTFGEIISNSEEYLSLYIYKTNEDQYDNYVEECKENGFIIEAEETESSFYAYDDGGYKLSLYFYEDENKMHIGVDAPKKYSEFEWLNSQFAKLLPVPKSNVGEIIKDDENGYEVYVAETTIEEFDNYVSACKENGFDIEVADSERYFSAKDSEGYKLFVEYVGNKVVFIRVEEPEYNVEIEIECVENWIFSKYDVEIYIDDSYEDTLTHGSTETYSLTLTKGTYMIKFVSAENDELTGEVKVDIAKNEELKFKISCSSFGIDVETIVGTADNDEMETTIETEEVDSTEDTTEILKITMVANSSSYKGNNYVDVKEEFEEIGFTNIVLVENTTSDVTITDGGVTAVKANDKDFNQGDSFSAETEIKIVYYKYVKPDSEYEKAYIRELNGYDLYYMFDTDTKKVVYFGTNDTYVEEGTYSGDFATGVTITWSHGQWTEKFTHSSGSYATLIDGSDWDWEYKVCDVGEAQEVLDGLK